MTGVILLWLVSLFFICLILYDITIGQPGLSISRMVGSLVFMGISFFIAYGLI